MTDLEEKLEQVDVVWLLSEVLLEQVVNGGLEHESVVNCNVTDVGLVSAGSSKLHIGKSIRAALQARPGRNPVQK